MHDHTAPTPDPADPDPPAPDDPGFAATPDGPQHTEAVPGPVVAARPVMATALLTSHPGNIRRELDLNPEFVASVAANGVLVPLRVTPDEQGYRVIDGHRRLAAALQARLAEVPVDVVAERAGDEPGQFLDMWTANRHRSPLRPVEEADALFAASQAGATRARIRKATGLKPAGVTAALAAARLSADTRARVEGVPLGLDQLAVVAEFEDDPQAVARLTTAAAVGRFDHEAEWLRQRRAEQAEHDRIRTELTDAGYAVTESLPSGACYLTALLHDGEDMTIEAHAACPGRAAFFRSFDLTDPVHYCADPDAHGHVYRYARPASQDALSTGSGSGARSAGAAGGAADPGADLARRLVIQGNKAWAAAGEVRKRWLATLLARKSAPREVTQFAARQLLAMGDPLRSGLAAAPGRQLLADLAGQPASRLIESCDTAAAGRLPLLIAAPVITAYEAALTDGEGRNTWRTDRYAPCPRAAAGAYLAFLASLGYQLSAIEQAVADGIPWTGDTPPGDTLTASTQGADDDTGSGADHTGSESASAADDDGTGAEAEPNGADRAAA
jgi:ParB family transcriptional regulator, chromosome partitioning protein